MKKVIVLFCIMGFCSLGAARDMKDTPRLTLDLPNSQVRVHHEPNIAFTVSNFGCFGSHSGDFLDPETGLPAPGFECPAGSGIEYLFGGAIWIGGTVDTIDWYGNPILDTLVSVGNDGWWGSLFELLPPPEGYPSMWEDYYFGDEDIHAIYYDTVTDARYVYPDPNDQRQHIPLGLKITQTSIGWSSPGYDELFAVNFYIENMRPRVVHDAWIGFYYDGDVFHESENPYGPDQGAQDDLCGYIDRGSHGIAWIADDNGQPYSGQYDYRSPRGAAGLVLLRSSEPGLGASFNWWVSNVNPEFDWGPQLIANFRGPFPGGGRGTPGGDKAKYQVMSNLEHDYDQAWSAIPLPGWITPPPHIADIANGYDTRFLISFGPMQLGIGEIETVTVALVGGRNVHNAPSNYMNYLRGHETDSASIALYYQNLDFSDLMVKADSAISFYQFGYPHPPMGPPHGFTFTEWSQNHVRLVWRPRNHPALRGYRLFRGTAPGVYDPAPLTPENFLDTAFVDNNVQDNITYYYAVASVDSAGRQGGYSPEVAVNSGIPHTPTGLAGTSGNAQAQLQWNAVPESDISGYIIYRALSGQPFVIQDSSAADSYLDIGLRNGIRYFYKVAAFDDDGNVSSLSDSTFVVPMGLNQGILLVNSNQVTPINPDYDSMGVFYQILLAPYRHTIINQPFDSLNDIANYSTVIWCGELVVGRAAFESYVNFEILPQYLQAGGRLIVAGPKMFMPFNSFGQRDFQAGDFAYDFLNLAGVRYPSGYTWDFDGGQSIATGLPDFSMDSTRVSRIISIPPGNNGRLYGVGNLIPRDTSETRYLYRAMFSDTSSLHGYPIAVVHNTPVYKTATLDFPLYFVEEPATFILFRLLLEELGEVVGIDEEFPAVPEKVLLLQNYPNPFNASTAITFALPAPGMVSLEIYDLLGRLIDRPVERYLLAGQHSVIWNGQGRPSGVYFYRLETPDGTLSRTMTLLK